MHHDNFTKGLRGEFRGDCTRDTFDPLRYISRVLMQQGRVQLDADWNEQVSISSYFLRTLAADLIGPHGAPPDQNGGQGKGFKIGKNDRTFTIDYGHYYVNGILCENNEPSDGNIEPLTYGMQPNYPVSDEELTQFKGTYLVYLDVWERHLSYVEDDYMREKALGGGDTATRAKIIWQVKLVELTDAQAENSRNYRTKHTEFLADLEEAGKKYPGTGHLRAQARPAPKNKKDPCLISPEAQYRGAENQLYRVEIHNGGEIRNEGNNGDTDKVTFKWSRENGSVIFPIIEVSDKVVTLEHFGRDARFELKPNDWVEIVDDDYILRHGSDDLLQVNTIDMENLQVTLKTSPKLIVQENSVKHPYLRRWDQRNGNAKGIVLKEGSEPEAWTKLEDGVEIQFREPSMNDQGEVDAHTYRTGDYWLIPARIATGDVEWPGTVENPKYLAAQGVDHHYAPLARIKVVDGTVQALANNDDLRRKVNKLWGN